MPPRTFPTSNPTLDFDRAMAEVLRRIADLESGHHRGPGCSFGVPFRITNGTVTWQLLINGDNGDLLAICETTGVASTIAFA